LEWLYGTEWFCWLSIGEMFSFDNVEFNGIESSRTRNENGNDRESQSRRFRVFCNVSSCCWPFDVVTNWWYDVVRWWTSVLSCFTNKFVGYFPGWLGEIQWFSIENTDGISNSFQTLPTKSIRVKSFHFSIDFIVFIFSLFCSVTHYPKIPRVYLSDVYLLTIYINIRCYVGPNICLSRLGRIPSRFGPGPYRQVLLDMFHHLLSTIYPQAQRALRRLDQTNNSECQINMKTELVKATRKASKLIRPISFPVEAQLIHQYLRHISTQLEACPNLISIEQIQGQCPDKCHRLTNTFGKKNISNENFDLNSCFWKSFFNSFETETNASPVDATNSNEKTEEFVVSFENTSYSGE